MESIGHMYQELKLALADTMFTLFEGIVTDHSEGKFYEEEADFYDFTYDATVDNLKNVSVTLCGEAIVGTRSMVPPLPTRVVPLAPYPHYYFRA